MDGIEWHGLVYAGIVAVTGIASALLPPLGLAAGGVSGTAFVYLLVRHLREEHD